MSEERVLQALQALAERDRALQAAPEMETLLVHEFRRCRAQRGWRWVAIGAVAAGIAITLLVVTSRPSRQPQTPVIPPPPVISNVVVAPPAAEAVTHKPVREPAVTRQSNPREVVTEFFPLMDPAPPFDRGQMLRVQLPAAAMRTVGLPVREDHLADPIQADVLVGEEGLPRAIRFVRLDTH